jgi:hypothetical protein
LLEHHARWRWRGSLFFFVPFLFRLTLCRVAACVFFFVRYALLLRNY